jgi:hypothetical protein
MDDVGRTSPPKRHVERIQHDLGMQCGCHRPTDNPPAEGIENDGEIEEPRPCRNVCNVCHPEHIRLVRSEVTVDEVGRLTTLAPHRRRHEPAAADPGEIGISHQAGHALAANVHPLIGKFGMNARYAIRTVGVGMRRADFRCERRILLCAR